MERFLLYLDDLDDLCFALLFAGLSRGRAMVRLIAAVVIGLLGLTTSLIAIQEPPIGAATIALLSVLLLYRSATARPPIVAS